ncbi:MAG: alpha/beta hydrolase [Bacteroidota bacterium]
MHKRYLILLLCALPVVSINGQNDDIANRLTGNWAGAFIKHNNAQRIEVEIRPRGENLIGLLIMEEWHPTFGESEVPIQIDSTQNISLPTGYGRAVLKLDRKNLELVGTLLGINPQISLHLKKQPRAPAPAFTAEAITVKSDTLSIHGYLHVPQIRNKAAVIIVGGRGCYVDQTKYNLYAKLLRRYGVTVLAYQKRGTGKSSGDCVVATIDDLAQDLIAAYRYLANHPNEYNRIGVLGISAGAWTIAKAAETVTFDFTISIVGPATSVKTQQLQSTGYGADFYKLANNAKSNAQEYITLLCKDVLSASDYARLTTLFQQAASEGWDVLLEETDKPVSYDRVNELWVRRHAYDPARVWKNYPNPLLAIYGERDWIVPAAENIEAFRQYFTDRPELLTTIVAPNAEHGMETEEKYVKLADQFSYWHFYRISPAVRIEIIEFLDKIGVVATAD